MKLKIIENLEKYNKDLVDIENYYSYVVDNLSDDFTKEEFKVVLVKAYMLYVKDDRLKLGYKIFRDNKRDFAEVFNRGDLEVRHQLLDLYCFCHMASEWMDYKQIYSFDVDTMEMLAETKQELTNEVLMNLKLPYKVFAIENEIEFDSGIVDSMLVKKTDTGYGFYLFNKEEKDKFKHQFLEIKLNSKSYSELLDSYETELRKFYNMIFNMLMYLAQPKVEILKIRNQIHERKNNKSFYGVAYEQNKVGYTLGSAIRQYKLIYEKGESLSNPKHKGGVKKPHTRCGHFHHYWTGKGRTELIVKYVEPTFVLGGSSKPTIRKVK